MTAGSEARVVLGPRRPERRRTADHASTAAPLGRPPWNLRWRRLRLRGGTLRRPVMVLLELLVRRPWAHTPALVRRRAARRSHWDAPRVAWHLLVGCRGRPKPSWRSPGTGTGPSPPSLLSRRDGDACLGYCSGCPCLAPSSIAQGFSHCSVRCWLLRRGAQCRCCHPTVLLSVCQHGCYALCFVQHGMNGACCAVLRRRGRLGMATLHHWTPAQGIAASNAAEVCGGDARARAACGSSTTVAAALAAR